MEKVNNSLNIILEREEIMNLDWYYTFLVLSKHLNYHRASEELFLTEPTLHQQIKKLEKHLQVNLFETVGRNLTLTPTGREFIPIVKKNNYNL